MNFDDDNFNEVTIDDIFTVVTLTTGRTLLIVNGYTFKKELSVDGGSRWSCNEPSQYKCDVYVHVNEKYEVTSIVNVHTHDPILYFLCNLEADLEDQNEYSTDLIYEEEEPVEALYVRSRKGTAVLQYKGHRYRRAYRTKNGTRWNCSLNKNCGAFIYLNDQDEILMSYEDHDHPKRTENRTAVDQNDTAVVITSRKGKEMLLFRKYTYRKQYDKGNKSRWICSTLKNCRGCVFTDSNNLIISAFEEHCHNPPKYYLKPDHVLSALREPLIIETD